MGVKQSLPVVFVLCIGPLIGASTPKLKVAPIEGLRSRDLRDSFRERHSSAHHKAIDIMEPHGTPVQAVVDGIIEKLAESKAGGTSIYLFDSAKKFCYYYAHLQNYVPDLQEGERVKRGEVIAYVGSTGNAVATAPHLHFAIHELAPGKRWWQGRAINPYPVLKRLLQIEGD
jgi:murein DD-endopeptidase MepM/ murein hydrolase activator NlpD